MESVTEMDLAEIENKIKKYLEKVSKALFFGFFF